MGFRKFGGSFGRLGRMLGQAGGGAAFDYYVDATGGSDSASGLSPTAAWQTLSKVNGFSFTGSKRIGLSGIFREQLTVPASNLLFDSYGGSHARITAMDVLSGPWSTVVEEDIDTGTITGSAGPTTANSIQFIKVTTGSRGGVLTTLHVYIGATPPTAVQGALYTDTSNLPDALIANTTSAQLNSPSANAWATLTVSNGATLAANTSYWVAINASSPGTHNRAKGVRILNSTFGTWPASAAGNTLLTQVGSYYLTIHAAGVPNVWSVSLATNPGVVLFDRVEGTRKANAAALGSARDYVYAGGVLSVYATSDPAALYTAPGVEGSVRNTALTATSKTGLTIKNIDFEGGILAWEGSVALHTCSGVLLDGCTMRYAGETSSGLYMTACGLTTIQDCTAEYNANDGAWIRSSTDTVWIHDNIFRLNGSGAAGDFEQLGCENNADLKIFNNQLESTNAHWVLTLVADTVYGASETKGNVIDHHAGAWPSVLFTIGNHTFHHNLVNGNGLGDGGVLWVMTNNTYAYASNAQIYQNTLISSHTYTVILVADGGVIADSSVDMRNNILSSAVSHILVQAGWAAVLPANAIDYNLYSHDTGTPFKWGATDYNFANWKTNSGQDAHSPAPADPLFVGGGDYTLQAGSPAIDAGVVIAGVTDGYLGAAPDMGYAEKA